jgi:electron transport complex protein RnfG
MERNYITQAWLMLLLALAFGGGLAGVQATLNPRIASNRRAETLDQIPRLVPGAASGERTYIGERLVYRAQDKNDTLLGWVVPAKGQGFADRIELLLGLDHDLSHITGVYILEQRETPGLGCGIASPAWSRQFAGKPTGRPLVVVKASAAAPHEVDGLTGATISSTSVAGIINRTVAAMRRSPDLHHGNRPR